MNVLNLINVSTEEVWLIGGTLLLMPLDWVTGYMQAVANKCVQSTKMREGIIHKLSEVCIIVLAVILQCLIAHAGDLGWSVPLVWAATLYLLIMEVNSIIENLKAAFPDLANSKLFAIFENSNDKEA